MTAGLEEQLAGHRFVAALPEGAPAALAACARTVRFGPGDLLFNEGTAADTLFLVTGGEVAVEVFGPRPDPAVLDTVGPGDVVGLSWVAAPFRWHFDARARTAVSAIAVDRDCLRERLEADPALGLAFLERFSALVLDRLQATRLRLLDLYGSGDDHRR